jgi:methionyl-tRNA formyltransferase
VGTVVHRIEPDGFDYGPVLVRTRYPLTRDTYRGDVYDWLDREVRVLLVEAARLLEEGNAHFEEQSPNQQAWLRCYPRRPEDSRIRWTCSAEEIHRLVRASSRPFSGAYTTLESQRKVIVWRAEPLHHRGTFLAIPGQVLYKEGDYPVIACGWDVLKLTEVSLEGCASDAEGKRAIGAGLRNRLI